VLRSLGQRINKDRLIFALAELVLILIYTVLFLVVGGSIIFAIPLMFQWAWNFCMVEFGLPSLIYGKAFILFWMWIFIARVTILFKPRRSFF
jgi:hypothetical protein